MSMNGFRAASNPKKAASALKRMGRKGDTELVHVNRAEMAVLDKLSPGNKRNPKTGLPEFNDDGGEASNAEVNAAIDASGQTDYGNLSDVSDLAGSYGVNDGPYGTIASLVGGTPARALDFVVGLMEKEGARTQARGGPIEAPGASRGDGYGGNVAVSGNGAGADGMNGADAGGNNFADALKEAEAEKAKETAPAAPLNADRPRVITGAGGNAVSSTRTFVQEALQRARKNLGGGDPPVAIAPSPPPGISHTMQEEPLMADGLDSIRSIVAGSGRRGDTELAHLSPGLQKILKTLGGSGGVNPGTGLREFAPAPLKNSGPVMAGDGADGRSEVDPNRNVNDEGSGGPIYVGPGSGTVATEPDISAFNSLAEEAGRIASNPRERQADLYGDIVRRRDALIGGYNDDQLGAVSGRYYGGAGKLSGTGGAGAFDRNALIQLLQAGDQSFYRNLKPTPNDAVRPPGTTPPVGGGGGTVPPGGGGGGIGTIDEGQQKMFNVDANGRPRGSNGEVLGGPTGIVGGGNGGGDISSVSAWLQANLPGMLRSLQPQGGQVASPGNLNAISASTNLVRSPVQTRRFRSRRLRSQPV